MARARKKPYILRQPPPRHNKATKAPTEGPSPRLLRSALHLLKTQEALQESIHPPHTHRSEQNSSDCTRCFDDDEGSAFSWQLVGSSCCCNGSHCSRSSRGESPRSPDKQGYEGDVGLFRWDGSGDGRAGDGGDSPSLSVSLDGSSEWFTPELGSEDSYPFSAPSSSAGLQVGTTGFSTTGTLGSWGRRSSCSSGTPTDFVPPPSNTPEDQNEQRLASPSIQLSKEPPIPSLQALPTHPLDSNSPQRIPRKRRHSAPPKLEPCACVGLEWEMPVQTAMERDDRQRVGQLALWRLRCESYLPRLRVGVPLHIIVDGRLYVPRMWEAEERKGDDVAVVVAGERGTVLEPGPEPLLGSDLKLESKAEAKTKLKTKMKMKAKSKLEPKLKSNWKAKRRAKLKLKQEQELKLKLEQELVSKLERERERERELELVSELVSKLERERERGQKAELTLQVDPEPGPRPGPEPEPKPAPALESVPEPMPATIIEVEHEPVLDPVPDQEPAPEPESAPQAQPLILSGSPPVYCPQPSVLDGRNPSYRLIAKGRKALRKKMGLPQWRRSGERPETGFMSRPMLLPRTEWLGIPGFGNWYVADGMGGGVCWSYDLAEALRKWRDA